jgi:hypothetical protein
VHGATGPLKAAPSAGGREAAVRGALVTAAVALAALVFWDTLLVYPLKILVVLLHEISHGLAAVATGGVIERIELSANEGGVCVTRGGSRFLILSAGYLGSLAWGALLLVVGARSSLDRPVVGALGLGLLAVTVIYVRTLFGFAYGVLAGAALVGVAVALPAAASDALLRLVGVVSCLYVVRDIASDLLLRDVPGSDANALAQLTGIPGVVWGGVWIVAACLVVALALGASVRGERSREAM